VWLFIPVLATSFWVAFGVLAASPQVSPGAAAAARPGAAVSRSAVPAAIDEVRDPALEKMIARFADAARRGR
jgi:hypothetical protein